MSCNDRETQLGGYILRRNRERICATHDGSLEVELIYETASGKLLFLPSEAARFENGRYRRCCRVCSPLLGSRSKASGAFFTVVGSKAGLRSFMQSSLRLGSPLPSEAIRLIERKLQMHHFKWDTQVGDESVLSTQPLLIAKDEWLWLCEKAERLAHELFGIEREIACSPRLQEYIGVPRPLRKLLTQSRADQSLRTLRFDFHLTDTGWVVSEVNSDVPGGFGEANALPGLYQEFVSDVSRPVSPLAIWGCTVEQELKQGNIALLYAPGFLEDQQVALVLARELEARGFRPYLIQTPQALHWNSDGAATIAREPGVPICAVIRFFQAEWLARLPAKTGWQRLFRCNGSTRIANPAQSVIAESKRLPLSFPFLTSAFETWRELSPAVLEPGAVNGKMREAWVLKAAYANNGDAVHLGVEMSDQAWSQLLRRAQKNPSEWIAQQRFRTVILESERGPVYPCVGVFVIGNRAAGAYVRLSQTLVTNAYALEAPLLIFRRESKS